jgi:hypothetical protein
VPGNRKGDGRAAKYAEVIAVVGVLPEIISVHDEKSSESLLNASIELIAKTGTNGCEGLAIGAVEHGVDRRIFGVDSL